MKLLALDFSSKQDMGVYYYEKCPHCSDIFFYRSCSMLRCIWDVVIFDADFKCHVADCVNKRVEGILNNGGYHEVQR